MTKKQTSAVNLAEMQPVDKTVHILRPDGSDEKIGLSFVLMSQDDPRLKAVKREIRDNNTKLTKGGRRSLKAKDIEANEMKLLCGMVIKWKWEEGVFFENGAIPDFNEKGLTRVFAKLSFVKDQLIEAIEDSESFFRNE